jgi:dimeric dUTPase (all-alpha-NTP-PPase superfamily)
MSVTIEEIVNMQVKNNDKTYPKWREDNLHWETAIIVEAVEAIDSLDWKWWKEQKRDTLNLKIEMVDILHFLISDMIVRDYDTNKLDKTLDIMFAMNMNIQYDEEIEEALIGLIEDAISVKNEEESMKKLSDSFVYTSSLIFKNKQELYEMYMAKNWLNGFRQENGYKNGTYTKIINGEEDNKLLFRLIEEFGLETAKEKFVEIYKKEK